MKKIYLFLVIVLFSNFQNVFAQNNCLNFDGTDDYVLSNAGSFTEYTYEAWVNLSSNANNNIIVYSDGSGPAASYSNQIKTDASGHFVHYFYDGSGKSVVGSTVATTGKWYHVAITAKNGGMARLYVNGVEEGTATAVSTLWIGSRLYIGSSSAGLSNFNGSLDDIKIWNLQRSQSSIQTDMYSEITTTHTQWANLISYYTFSSGTSCANNSGITTANDTKGSYNGTLNNFALNGCTSNWIISLIPKPAGNAINFDGVDDYVSLTGNFPNPASSDFTLEALVYPLSSTGALSIFRKTGYYNLYLSNGNIAYEIWDDGIQSWRIYVSSIIVPTNSWSHIALTWNNSTNSAIFYLNGMAYTTGFGSGTINQTEALCIGASTIYGNYFYGNIDECRVWNVERTQAQIQNSLNSYLIGNEAGLVGYYRFDQGNASGTNNTLPNEVIDITGNCNKGTLTNFALSGASSNWVNPGNLEAPILTSTAASSISNFSAALNGNVLSVGENSVTTRGFQISTSSCLSSPTVVSETGTFGTGAYSLNATGLLAGVTYYYRSFATNTMGTSYGETQSFTTTVFTPLGNALHFDGNDYISSASNVDLGGNITFEAWINTGANNDWDGIISNEESTTNHFLQFNVTATGYVKAQVGTPSGLLGKDATTTLINNNVWHHVACTFEASTQTLKLYVDGILQTLVDNSSSGSVSDLNVTGKKLRIGSARIGGYELAGYIDEVRAWNTVRTQSQIQTDMYSYVTSAHSQWANLKAYYRFDQGNASGTNTGLPNEAIDYSGNCKKGTLTNFALTGASSNWVYPGNAEAPVLTSEAATSVTACSATLNGNVFSIGETSITTRGFEISTSSCLTSPTVVSETGTFTTGTFSLNATGLTASATYYFRSFATNSKGTSYGETRSFSTVSLPTISGTTPGSRCDAGTVVLGATASGGTINWWNASTAGTNLGTGTSYTTSSISSNTTYYVDATENGCTSSSRTSVLATVYTTPTISGVTDGSRCDAGTVNLGASASAGTINWYLAATGGSSLATGTTYTSPVIASTSTFYVDATANGCTTTSRSAVTATVTNTPTISSTTGAARCSTGTVSLSAASSAGTINWYSASTGGSSLATGTSYTTPSISSTTSYYVDATLNGCTTASRTSVTATVNPLPTVTISGTTTICFGQSTTVTAAGANNYVWTSGPSTAAYTASPTTTTSYTVTGTETVNNCSNTATVSVTVNPLPSISISISEDSTCAGVTTTLTASGGATYSWHHDASSSNAVSVSPSITTAYTVSGYSALGCENTASQTVMVYPFVPNSPGVISGPTTVCNGSTGNAFSVSTVPYAVSYSWTVPPGSTITSGQGTRNITVTIGTQAGNISCKTINPCGQSNFITRTLTLQSTPQSITGISGSTKLCFNSTNNTYTVSGGSGATAYSWTVPTGSTIVSGQGTSSIKVNFGTTSGNITATPSNSCFTGTAYSKAITLQSSITPSTPGTISGPVNICSYGTGSITYSVAAVTGAVSYSWTVPTGITISSGQGTTSIVVNAGAAFTSGNITVYAVGQCGTSLARTKAITENVSMPASISGNAILCGTSTYSAAAVNYATSYTWTVPSGVTINSGQGTRTISVTNSSGTMAGNISVAAINACNTSAYKTKAIQAVPLTPASISGPTTPCASSVGNLYTVPIVSGVTTYSWTAPAGATIVNGQGTRSINVTYGTTAGNITAMAGNTCGYSGVRARAITFSCKLTGDNLKDGEIEEVFESEIYPNPFGNSLHINLNKDSKVEIFNINGAIVNSQNLIAGENELNTLDLIPGVYFVKINDGINSPKTFKLLKQ